MKINGLQCSFCGKEYKSNKRKNIIKHVKHCLKNPNHEKYKCECGKEYDKRYSLSAHKTICNKEKRKCDTCGLLFFRLGKHKCYANYDYGTPKRRRKKKEGEYNCCYCNTSFENGSILGGHKSNCSLNPNAEKNKKARIISAQKNKGTKLSEETKRKISESRIKYIQQNPDKAPYLMNHSSKMSYPEKRFKEALEYNNITGWKYNFQNGIYQYDFAFIDLKLDVEIDGGTHLLEKVKKIDERRDKFSISKGWTVLRFTAKQIKSDINKCISELNTTINKLISTI